MSKYRFALQLYTVRHGLEKDVLGTLKAVKAAGYDNVELAGTCELAATDFRRLIRAAALRPIGAHISYTDALERIDHVITMAKTLDVRYLSVGSVNTETTLTLEDWAACGRALNEAGRHLREAGLRLLYHNHAQEFNLLDGRKPLEVLLEAAEPENLSAQLDLFWIQYAGYDPVAALEKFAGRCPVIHVKDMRDARSKAFAEMGRGILNWKEIMPAADAAGVRWFVVEQDICARDPIESIKISALFMAEQ